MGDYILTSRNIDDINKLLDIYSMAGDYMRVYVERVSEEIAFVISDGNYVGYSRLSYFDKRNQYDHMKRMKLEDYFIMNDSVIKF